MSKMFEHFISQPLSPSFCPKCRQELWSAVIYGFTKRVDPTPLEPIRELQCRMAGEKVYQAENVGSGVVLRLRSAIDIAKADPRAVALVEHRCGRDGESGRLIELFAKPEYKEAPF